MGLWVRRSLRAVAAGALAVTGLLAVSVTDATAAINVSGTALSAVDHTALPVGSVRVVACSQSTVTTLGCPGQIEALVDGAGNYSLDLADDSWYVTPYAVGTPATQLAQTQLVAVTGGVPSVQPDFL